MDIDGDLPKDEDTFKILLATDLHIGYMDTDPVRKDDSLKALEEVLQIATDKEVDFILMAGDLFHENKPSRQSLNGCIVLLRRFCLGNRKSTSSVDSKQINFEVISDQSVNFENSSFHWANFDDPNLNVTMPIFTIHGNHDDPTGTGLLSPIDILSSSGLVNYFGKVTSLDNIELTPILLRKGITKLSIFGIGSVRDQRLHQLFTRRRIKALRPAANSEEWFNIFVLHQNRAAHGPENFIPENCIPSFIDLVMWGHEHECRIDPEWNPIQKFYVTQPGSTIITSLSEGEELPKHVALLQVWKKSFKMQKIPLKSVRRLYMDTINIDDSLIQKLLREKMVEKYFADKIEHILIRAAQEREGNASQPELPLVRVRSDVSLDIQNSSNAAAQFSIVRFGQTFVGRVANPKSLLHFSRKKTHHAAPLFDTKAVGIFDELSENSRVEDLVKVYFSNAEEKHCLEIMSENTFCDAVKYSADKDDKEFMNFFINYQINRIQQELTGIWSTLSEDKINDRIKRLKLINSESLDIETLERERCKASGTTTGLVFHSQKDAFRMLDKCNSLDLSDPLDEPEASSISVQTRGKRRGRASTANQRALTRGTRGTRASKRDYAQRKEDVMDEFLSMDSSKTQKTNDLDIDSYFSVHPSSYKD